MAAQRLYTTRRQAIIDSLVEVLKKIDGTDSYLTNLYQQVKDYVLSGISNGSWQAGERVPSENELVDLCQVSRMTARRALQELLQEGTLIRIKGKGSFDSRVTKCVYISV